MTISSDRADIVAALKKADYHPLRVSPHPPTKLAANLAYVTLMKVEPGSTFGNDLLITWQITATASPTASAAEATAQLDELTDAIIFALHSHDAAGLAQAGEYVGLLENANGATYPAVQITFESVTPEKGNLS